VKVISDNLSCKINAIVRQSELEHIMQEMFSRGVRLTMSECIIVCCV